MDFYILSASNSEFKVNSLLIKSMAAGELGAHAISVASEYVSYKDSILSVYTQIIAGGLTSNAFHEALDSSYYSTFEIAPGLLGPNGNQQDALAGLVQCHQLAQAHAYAIFYCSVSSMVFQLLEWKKHQ